MRIISIAIAPLNMVKSFAIIDKKVIIVDTGFEGSGDKILKKLNREGIRNKDISLILLTHSHADHSGSALYLKNLLNVPVAIHKAETHDLTHGIKRPYRPTSWKGKLWLNTPLARTTYDRVKPDVILEDSVSLEIYGVRGRIIHTPGHTPGSISIFLDNGELIAGDLLAGGIFVGGLMNHGIPIIPPFHEDIPLTKSSVQKVLNLNPKKIHVCHGGPLNIKKVQNMVDSFEWVDPYKI